MASASQPAAGATAATASSGLRPRTRTLRADEPSAGDPDSVRRQGYMRVRAHTHEAPPQHQLAGLPADLSAANFAFLLSAHLPFYNDRARMLLASEPVPVDQRPQQLDRALHVLDQVPTLDTHKIGVLYVGPGQATAAEILGNEHGSRRS